MPPLSAALATRKGLDLKPALGVSVVALGIIAGSGSYPRHMIAQAQKRGYPVCVVALEGQCDPETIEGLPHVWTRLGGVGKALAFLRQHRVSHVAFAGGVQRPSFAQLHPDWMGLVCLAKLTRAFGRGDDGLLRAIVGLFEQQGLQVIGSKDLLNDDFFMSAGAATRAQPDAGARADIARGLEVLRALGLADVGQAVVVQQGLVLGIEAIEGTAALIARCGALQRPGRKGVLIKISKTKQDDRVDLPTVGPDTVDQLVAAGLQGMTLEAGKVQVLDKEIAVQKANAAGIFMYGVSNDGI